MVITIGETTRPDVPDPAHSFIYSQMRKFFRKQFAGTPAKSAAISACSKNPAIRGRAIIITQNAPGDLDTHRFSIASCDDTNNNDLVPAVHYLHFSINGTNYEFVSPLDPVLYDDQANALLYFQNAEATQFGWLNFKTKTPYYAGAVELFDTGAGTGLLLYENLNSGYPVTITEYSNTNEFISGHYSGIYTDARNNPIYNFSCSFRARRNKCK